MVPFLNRPIMEYSLHLLRRHGFIQAVASLHYLPEAIMNYFGDGRDWKINLRYSLERSPLGTAGGVRLAAQGFDETFVVLSGDGITDIDLEQAIAFHRQRGALATIVLTRVENPLEFGVVLVDKDGRIRRFLEKPGWSQVFSDTINTGIYILEPEVLEFIPPEVPYDFSQDLFPALLAAKKPLFGFVAEGYWCDIGNLEQYRQASIDFLQGKIRLPAPGEEIAPGIWAAKSAAIDPRARLNPPLVIGEGTTVAAGAWVDSFTVLGKDVVMESGASSKRSIIWDRAQLGYRSEVRGSVLGTRVRLAERAAVLEGAVLADDVFLGRGAIVRPRVKVWPAKVLENETVLTDHLIWGATQRKTLFGHKAITGKVNYELTPELAAKLGAAFGTLFERGSTVVVGSDGGPAANLIKGALLSGLLSTGINVYDLGQEANLTPITRYAVVALAARGGIHLKSSHVFKDGLSLEFFDARGLNISQKLERKIENALERDDYRRVSSRLAGQTTYQAGLAEAYRRNVLRQVDTARLRQHPQRLVLLHPAAATSLLLDLFAELGWNIHSVPYQHDFSLDLPAKLKESWEVEQSVPEPRWDELPPVLVEAARVALEHLRADLAAVMGPAGEELILVTENGKVVEKGTYTLLATQVYLRRHPQGAVVLPVTAPQAAEKLVGNGGHLVRSASRLPILLEKAWEASGANSPADGLYQRVPFWLYQLDAPLALLLVLEELTLAGITLGRYLTRLPRFSEARAAVPCRTEAKGRVLRKLTEEAGETALEALEGVTFQLGRGRALILPDAVEPLCQIYCEASTLEDAAELARHFAQRVKELAQE